LLFLSSYTCIAQSGKVKSDCTVSFDVKVQDNNADPQITKAMLGATKVLYIKGSRSRNDLITPGFKQITLIDAKSDTAVILRELGNTKYLTYLYGDKRRDQNKRYAGIEFDDTGEKKTILGYDCKKVTAKLANGSTYSIFYTTTLTPSNTIYEYQFKDLKGLVLEYEGDSTDGKTKIKYIATKITLLPVPNAMFDLPKSGYRIL